MRLTRRLEDIRTLGGDPVVLEIAPAALEHETVHRLRVTVARQHARLAHLEQVHPVALRAVEAERPEPDILGLRHPQPVVGGNRIRNDDFRQCVHRHRKLVGHAGVFVFVGGHSAILFGTGGSASRLRRCGKQSNNRRKRRRETLQSPQSLKPDDTACRIISTFQPMGRGQLDCISSWTAAIFAISLRAGRRPTSWSRA